MSYIRRYHLQIQAGHVFCAQFYILINEYFHMIKQTLRKKIIYYPTISAWNSKDLYAFFTWTRPKVTNKTPVQHLFLLSANRLKQSYQQREYRLYNHHCYVTAFVEKLYAWDASILYHIYTNKLLRIENETGLFLIMKMV
jgi:hypothetical protein